MENPSQTRELARAQPARAQLARTQLARRTLLRGGVLVPVVAAATAGCTGSSPEEPDPLEPLAEAARSDARLAEAVARAHPDLASRAGTVASVREEHAKKLRQEVQRLNPPDPDEPSTKPSSPAPAPPPAADAAAEELRRRLREAQAGAARVVPSAPRYRAGLCGSVSAGCASLVEVLG